MKTKVVYILFILSLFSCSKEREIDLSILQNYIEDKSNLERDEVIACAASAKDLSDDAYIFFYPIPSATNIQYFETDGLNVDKNDFKKYHKVVLEKQDVFNGYLGRFVKKNKKETWCVVTYESAGKLHVSNPIKLKQITKPTEWVNSVIIDQSSTLMPKFSWSDGRIKENAIYFEVITDEKNNLLSGTYTYDKWFQYYKLDNVVLNVTRDNPPKLINNNEYGFTMMGVSEDNWVNLVIQKSFIAN